MKEILIKPLRRYFRSNKIKYSDIADAMCVSDATVVNWLNHGKISLKKLEALMLRFDIKIEVNYGSDAGHSEKKTSNKGNKGIQ